MTKKPIILFLLTIWTIISIFPAQTTENKNLKFENKITDLIEIEMKKHDVQGLNLSVVTSDSVLYSSSFGVKNIYTKEPVTDRSLFHIASVTKTFVAAALMQLHEEGKLDIHKPVVDVVPYFRLVDKRYKNLTIRQFASHITGMPDFDSDPWHHKEYDEKALERFVRDFISHKFLIHAPDTVYQYCNTGFELLGDVIAKASGMSFEDYMMENILKPLGMKDSTLLIREADMTKLNSLHHKKDGKIKVADIYPYNRAHGPSSTLISNGRDMQKYLQMILRDGRSEKGQQILKKSSLDFMFKPATAKIKNVGFTWHRRVQQGYQVLYHGGNDGFKAYIAFIPELNIGFHFMTNTAEMSYHDFAKKITDMMINHKK